MRPNLSLINLVSESSVFHFIFGPIIILRGKFDINLVSESSVFHFIFGPIIILRGKFDNLRSSTRLLLSNYIKSLKEMYFYKHGLYPLAIRGKFLFTFVNWIELDCLVKDCERSYPSTPVIEFCFRWTPITQNVSVNKKSPFFKVTRYNSDFAQVMTQCSQQQNKSIGSFHLSTSSLVIR